MREHEGLYRTTRLLKRVVLGVVALVLTVAVVGYVFLMRQVAPRAAWVAAAREVDGTVLHYGESPQRIARVYRRRGTNYFRAANGLLVATPERLLFVGVEPRDKLAGEDAPATIVTSEFQNDTLVRLASRRVYALSAHGVVVTRMGHSEEFAAAGGHEEELDSLIAYVDRRNAVERRLAAEDRALRAAVAELERRPLRYEVVRGDALSTIAARFGATPEQIRAWNGMTTDRVRIRDTLVVRPAG